MESDQENDWDALIEEEKDNSQSNYAYDQSLDYDPQRKVANYIEK